MDTADLVRVEAACALSRFGDERRYLCYGGTQGQAEGTRVNAAASLSRLGNKRGILALLTLWTQEENRARTN